MKPERVMRDEKTRRRTLRKERRNGVLHGEGVVVV